MMRVIVRRSAGGEITGFSVRGHAGFAPEGSDIVCAAVSVLTQTALRSLDKLLQIKPVDLILLEGKLECRFQPAPGREGQLILEAMVVGLTETAINYRKYLALETRRENNGNQCGSR